jgi:hypothetical protein
LLVDCPSFHVRLVTFSLAVFVYPFRLRFTLVVGSSVHVCGYVCSFVRRSVHTFTVRSVGRSFVTFVWLRSLLRVDFPVPYVLLFLCSFPFVAYGLIRLFTAAFVFFTFVLCVRSGCSRC